MFSIHLTKQAKEYTILLAFLLLLVMTGDVRGQYKVSTALAMLWIIAFWTTGNAIYAIYIAAGAVLLLYMLTNGGSIYAKIERFDNEKKSGDLLKEIDTKLSNKAEEEDDQYKEKHSFSDMATAQKETFTLIKTVEQLQDTMKALAPTLKEGKKVLEMFEKLKVN